MLRQNKLFTIIIMMLLFFAASVSLNEVLNPISLYIALPVAFMITFLHQCKIKVNEYMGLLLLLYCWVLFVTPFSVNIANSAEQLKQILGCILLCYIFASQAKNPKMIVWLYLLYIVLYIGTMDYAINNIMLFMDKIGGRERVGDEKLNANTLAYYTFFLTFSVFIMGEIIQKKWLKKVFNMAFFLVVPLSLWISIITASRQVLLLQVPLITILIYLRYVKFGNWKTILLLLCLVICIVIYFYDYIMLQYGESYLAERSQRSFTEDSRFVLIKESVELGLNNMFVGVGPSCVRLFTYEKAFSHNTFLELWAGTGLIGMLIYTYIVYLFFKRQMKRYKHTKDKMFLYFTVFGCFYLLDQMFYVFYASLWLIGFFILVASHSETYFNFKYRNLKHIK